MGFGAGDIKDKFRTYDGDADKRLRKKLEKSGKFDESFKTPVRIEKINVEVMGRWVSERLAELLGFEDDVLSELVMNMRDSGPAVLRRLPSHATSASTRLVSIRRGRGWSLNFGAIRTDLSGKCSARLAQTRDAKTGQDKRVDPQQLQVQLTGFLNKQAQPFVAELWKLLLDAQDAPARHSLERSWRGRRRSW